VRVLTSGSTVLNGAEMQCRMAIDGRERLDPETVAAAHLAAEFELRSVDAVLGTMTDDPVVLHVPTSIGGRGLTDVRRFYADYFIGTFPDDFAMDLVSVTVGATQLAQEMVVSFTHDRHMPGLLPNLPATGRQVELALVTIVRVEHDKVASEHFYWDHASLLVQVGVLDPETVPVLGSRQTRALRADRPTNELLADW
jgi:carboxymethylenebutenolidase